MTYRNELHKRNKHCGQYNFSVLIENYEPLREFVVINPSGVQTIDFFNPHAVKALNKSLLLSYYKIDYWDIPQNYLCPPIPGRADYIHYVADLIQTEGKQSYRCLDIGVGANCIYPIIGCVEYGWTFVGSDIDSVAIENARKIITSNSVLANNIELRLQKDSRKIFDGIFSTDEYFDVVICNPPFHSSQLDAKRGSLRKLRNLKGKRVTELTLNFSGKSNELWCEGGELRFLSTMISESEYYGKNCGWFTSLVSKDKIIDILCDNLKAIHVSEYKIIEMQQGSKSSRLLAWRFKK